MTLKGTVAWVTQGGGGVGRAVAVELAAHGARVLVTGAVERALGETVGEIVFQGGTARHLVADGREQAQAAAAARRAVELWGRLDVVVACCPERVEMLHTFEAAAAAAPACRQIAVGDGWASGSVALSDEELARRVVLAVDPEGDTPPGQVLHVGGASASGN